MRCPRDNGDLVVRDTEGHVGFRCSTCQGAWLPARFVQSIQYTHVFSYAAFARALTDAPLTATTLRCPTGCGTLGFVMALDVPVMWCSSCRGVWFEPGAIRALLERMPRVEAGLASAGLVAGQLGGEIALWTILLGLLS